jgi:hypothetical protein
MKRFIFQIVIGFSLALTPVLYAAPVQHHELRVRLIPSEHRIEVTDKVTLSMSAMDLQITLNPDLVSTIQSPDSVVNQGKDFRGAGSAVLSWTMPTDSFTVSYNGAINFPLRQVGQEYARGQKDTVGSIGPDGVYLDRGSGWYPHAPQGSGEKITFDLTVELPAGWDAVSQGARTEHRRNEDGTLVRYRCDKPQDSIWLVAGKYAEYTREAGNTEAMVFLREPDNDLAGKYLDATSQYIGMYEELIGPYPYGKFALVENFWETGYGMPSFTLMGPRIIRFPFILHSSYPHEILHNWWGNSVYIDYGSGNWGEGLTAYLSDHLIKEQRGQGAQYRQETLQKYADYVLTGRDLPLSSFRSRHGSVTEAVGYGKSLMLFHMLRQSLGDEIFKDGLRKFYSRFHFSTAGFDDLKTVLENVSGKNLEVFFNQWVKRSGAPELGIRDVKVNMIEGEYVLTAILEQIQKDEVYQIEVPLVVTVQGEDRAVSSTFQMTDRRMKIELALPARPLRLDLDPGFDLFRRLDRNEIPPALTQAFGAEDVLIVLPSEGSNSKLQAYRKLADQLSGAGPGRVEVTDDSGVRDLPPDRTVWIFGMENSLVEQVKNSLVEYDVSIDEESIRIEGSEIPKKGHSIVITARHPKSPALAVMWLATDSIDALPGLGRKLPHYHKYSYLAFAGSEPENVAKGRWPVVNSPLTVLLPGEDGKSSRVEMGKLHPEKALAELPPIFSRENMMETIRLLSGSNMGGRGYGTEGLDRVAEFIADRFSEMSLKAGGDNEGSYFQTWTEKGGELNQETRMRNVIGIVPGRKAGWDDQSVIVGAHYDHLGRGWPGALSINRGKIHPGADDNASGVAVMLELAKVLSEKDRPDRTIIFVAFTGEETGRNGSEHYVMNQKDFPVDEVMGMVNLDTVGRLGGRPGNNRLLILGAGSASEWIHIFRGAGYVTGVEIQTVSDELDSSDHVSFQAAGVPAVQLFTGAHLDYHKPSDIVDRINPDGLVKVAAVAKEAVKYLASREEPLTSSADEMSGKWKVERGKGKGERKVSMGTVPDFSYEGEGVRLDGVVPGSPAEKAGLMSGDIIIRLGDENVGDLKDMSNILKTHSAGETLRIVFLRDGTERTVEAVLVER